MVSDPPEARPWGRQLLKSLQRIFVSGILVVVPVTVTVYVLYFLFRKVDGLLSPLLVKYFQFSAPGLGVLATILLILVVGVIARNFIGSRLFGLGELVFVRTPLVRAIYLAAKQLLQAITHPDRKTFGYPVLIEYPRPGLYTLGFVSARTILKEQTGDRNMIAVFVPSTPTPVTGFVVILPVADVHPLEMSAEEAVKFVVSGGFASPAVMNMALPQMVEA